MKPKHIIYLLGAALAAIGTSWTLHGVFYDTPMDDKLYFNQKIFYWHVPHAIFLFAAVTVCGIAGLGYLRNRKGTWDDVAQAAGELAVCYGAIVLATGSIWGRAAWGKWWVWDMRLTQSLLLWLVMVGYVIVRRFGGPGSERLAAGLAVFGMVDIPLIYYSVKIWNTLHPSTDVTSNLDPGMRGTFYLSMLTFAIVFTILLLMRVETARADRQLRELRERALDAGLIE
jgi:heme exporter protein C